MVTLPGKLSADVQVAASPPQQTIPICRVARYLRSHQAARYAAPILRRRSNPPMAAPGGSSLDDILLSAAGGVGAGDGPSLNGDIPLLIRAWCNEKAAPEILPYPAALVGALQTMLKAQEEAVAALPTGPDAVNPAVAAGYHMDLQRVRFLLAAFLRTRLLKAREVAVETSASIAWRLHPPLPGPARRSSAGHCT